ncbi:MAG TPA: crosslink repair DNA glycosylase YcaQ family protein [Galbitalea sp.]
MGIRNISQREARQIAVRAALLDASRPDDILELVRGITMLRVELTPTVAPSADHIAWSRLGAAYRLGEADRALALGPLFERDWMLRPMSDLGLYVASARTWPDRANTRGWMDANADFANGILDRIADLGPLTSRDIPDEAFVPWPSTGWSNNRNVTKMLECLHMVGELAVVGRAGRLRIWDLAGRVYPPTAEVPLDEARRIRSERLLGACGIMRDSRAVSPIEVHGLAEVGQAVTIDGVRGRWRVDPDQLGRSFDGRTAILSPFDRLMTDPQRIARLFEFDYTLEMYKPSASRVWGQFALPILHGDRLVGKVDARSDYDTGRFVVHRVHEDESFAPSVRDAVDEELDSFASWLRLSLHRA